eukprot:13192632-Ditylum_brightwellii.AAC.1
MGSVAVSSFLVAKPMPEPMPKVCLVKKSTVENNNDNNDHIFDDNMGKREKEAKQSGTGNRFVTNEAEVVLDWIGCEQQI